MADRKIIILTEKQLKEASSDFEYTGKHDANAYDALSKITVSGKVGDGEEGKPADTDRIADTQCAQTYRRYGNIYGRAHVMRESDSNGDGVDDFYNNGAMNTLTNDTENDDMTKVPESVITKLDMFISTLKNTSLTPRQNAIILTKVISALDTAGIPYRWKKELMMKINAKG